MFVDSWNNDVALIKLSHDLPLAPADANVDMVKLPDVAGWPPGGATCNAHGWGCTQKGKHFRSMTLPVDFSPSNILMATTIYLYT